MGMYNLVFGNNPHGAVIMACLGLRPTDIGRFRDVFVEKDFIAVYTRNGGNNRDCVESYIGWGMRKKIPATADSADCDCSGCAMTHRVPKLEHFSHTKDDEFDNTYATIYFKHPPEFADDLAKIAMNEPFDPDQRWHDAIAAIGGNDAG